MRRRKKILIAGFAGVVLVVFCRCLEIDTVVQPRTAVPGDTVVVTLNIHSQDTDPNPHSVFATVLLPNGWKALDLTFESDKYGSGDFISSLFWADSCEKVYPSGDDSHWWGFLSENAYLANEVRIDAVLTLRVETGPDTGSYFLGYTLGEDALGYDTSWGDVYDSSLNHPIQIRLNIEVPGDFPTIQSALDSVAPGVWISVSSGTYHERIQMRPGVSLFGSDSLTVIDGGSLGTVVLGADHALIQNFTFRNAGFGNPLVQNDGTDGMEIRESVFEMAEGEKGIETTASVQTTVENCRFEGSTGSLDGIRAEDSEVLISGNRIENCRIGILADRSSVSLLRNLIIGCMSHGLDLGFCQDGSVANNTLAFNDHGMRLEESALPVFNNVVVHSSGYGISAGGSALLSYNDVWSNSGGDVLAAEPGTGALCVDPLFVGGEPFDYNLQSNSPCIDAGDPDGPPDPDGTVSDIGAFFHAQPGIPSSVRNVYLCHFTHLDIGFTDPQSVVADQYKGIIDKAIAFADQIPEFQYTVESLWQLEEWMKRSTSSEINHLRALVNQGQIHLSAGYATMHTAVMGSEELFRFLYPCETFRQTFSAPVSTLFQNDVPGYAWTLPTVLADAGVKYMIAGINTGFGGGPDIPQDQNPFFWQGPDNRKILTWISFGSYIEWYSKYRMFNLQTFYNSLSAELASLEYAGYPYDAILILLGSLENTNPTTLVSGMARLWNQTYANPKLIVAGPEDFFVHMEEKYGDQFPTFSGDWSGAWDIISLNVPQSMAMNRFAHDHAPIGETMASVAGILDPIPYPSDVFSGIFRNMLLFDEHSGGGAPWPGLMTPEETQEQSETAFGWARDAFDSTSWAVEFYLEKLARSVKGFGSSMVVFNPLSWERSDVVRLSVDSRWTDDDFLLIDRKTGNPVPFAVDSDKGEIIFLASNVPAMGYKTYERVETADSSGLSFSKRTSFFLESGQPKMEDVSIQNDRFIVRVDPGQGAMVSILDRIRQREWISNDGSFSFNECIKADPSQAASGRHDKIFSGTASVVKRVLGSVGEELIITRSGSPFVRTEIRVFNGIPRIEIINTSDRRLMDWVPESVGFEFYAYVFPFLLPNADVYLDGAGRYWNPAYDCLPGAPRGFFAVQKGGCLTDGLSRLLWANRESFVVEFERFHGLNTNFDQVNGTLICRFLKKEDEGQFEDGTVGPVDVEPGASQIMKHGFAFCPDSGSFDPIANTQFSSSFLVPLQAIAMEPSSQGLLPDSGLSFFNLDVSNVVLLSVKRAQSDNGWILRLHELAGHSTTVTIFSDVFHFESAHLTDGMENETTTNVLAGDGLQIVFEPYSFKTVHIHAVTKSTSVLTENDLNHLFDVFPNFPNPFNGQTMIRVKLPKKCSLELNVFNANGQKVRTLWQGVKNAGFHSLSWDGCDDQGRNLASGIYLAEVSASEYVKTIKMILMR